MPVQLDWKEAQSSGFTPLEEGEYGARISNISEEKARQSGNDMIVFEFTMADNRRYWERCTLTPKAMFRLFNVCTWLGMTGEEVTSFDTSTELVQELRSRFLSVPVYLQLTIDPNNTQFNRLESLQVSEDGDDYPIADGESEVDEGELVGAAPARGGRGRNKTAADEETVLFG